MGVEISKAECNLNTRYFIGHKNSAQILEICGKHKMFWALGFAIITTIALFFVYWMTRNNDPNSALTLPIWIAFSPIVLFFIYSLSIQKNQRRLLAKESLEHELSGMERKEYLNYKAGDDRATKGFFGSATSAGILSGTNILGPYIRADR